MQFIPFCLFTILCGYSLVIAAPVNHTIPDTQEAKQQKATEIASRLLKELAGEQDASQHIIQSTTNEENKDTSVPVNQLQTEKVQSHVVQQADDDAEDDSSNDDNEDLELTPTIDDLHEFYNTRYAQTPDDDEESSAELINDDDDDDDDFLPINRQQLIQYLIEQDEDNEQLTPVLHTPVIDDSIMTAENHRQQRRRRSVY